jgi:hypothetical protein
MPIRRFLWIVFVLIVLAVVPTLAQAQTGVITLTGIVSEVRADAVVVNGLTISLAETTAPAGLVVGAQISVTGTLRADGVIVAQVIIIIAPPGVTATPTATLTPVPTLTAVIDPSVTPTLTATPNPLASPTATPITPDDDDVIIVIEGPVIAIQINIITIYDIDIAVAPDDPLLTVIQIGDIVRVEGILFSPGDDDDDFSGILVGLGDADIDITIIAITIIIVDIDVFVGDDGAVWRDDGDCGSPPPPWAPAHGWRARCEGGDHPGRGRGDDDDDDD